MLRSPIVMGIVPDENDFVRHEFFESIVEKQEIPVYDKNGKVVRTDVKNVPVRNKISDEVLEHKGIKASMFSIQNQVASGVNMQPMTGSFLKPSLEDRQNAADYIDNTLSEIENESKTTNNE